MRSLAISALALLGATATAAAQPLAGGPGMLDCRPVMSVQTEKGVAVTRGYRAQDREPVGTFDGYRCYAANAQAGAPDRSRQQPPARGQTIIILNGGDLPYGFNVGTSPNVLGAPQPRRF